MMRLGTDRLRAPFVSVAALGLLASWSFAAQETFSDDFDRPDGPVDGWTVSQGAWQISGGQMTTIASVTESDIWAGAPALRVVGDLEMTAKVTFGTAPADAVGRHGGFIFFASELTHRTSARQTGYTIDWIDRAGDRGFRIHRIDPGAAAAIVTPLWTGTPELVDVPETWRVQFDGDQIRVFADDVLAVEITDGTYREGMVGAWVYQNGTRMSVDDFELVYFPKVLEPCFTVSADEGPAPLSVAFDATCTQSVLGIASYEWDFGDGEFGTGETAEHEFLFGGSYMVTLTVRDAEGNTGTAEKTIEVYDSSPSFHDDFERADGPVDGWTVYRGDWRIEAGRLATSTAGLEAWAWAGDPPYSFPANFTLTFTLEFVAHPADAVGRHGGVMFCAKKPTQRFEATNVGYEIDWIDRATDHGIRLVRFDGGTFAILDIAARDPVQYPDPPTDWKIVVEGPAIRIFGDGELLLEAEDATYRRGLFGVWAYSNGQELAFDDMDVSSPAVSPCFTVEPGEAVEVGTELAFDARCSSATGTPIRTYAWDFGDGTNAEGLRVTHTYAEVGTRTVTLTVTTEGGLSASTVRTVDVYRPLEEFADDFERADGPPSGWTVRTGEWAIRSGGLEAFVADATAEAWIYAGDPPARFRGFEAIRFRMEFLSERPADPSAIGRHAGVFFFAEKSLPRGNANSGYGVDWLDRISDGGYRIYRMTNGAMSALLARAPDAEPGTEWRIEVDGDAIRLFVDGALKAEAFDSAYRFGHFAFWTSAGDPETGFVQQVLFDDLEIGAGGGPPKPIFHRGDANADGGINITDGIYILNYLFLGGPGPPCLEAANPNDDDAVNITDGIYVLNFLFLGGPAPADPGPADRPCGPDPAGSPSDLGCASYTAC
ncbi:MAG: PKD domain-containing protein [Planctomycetota bacterium]